MQETQDFSDKALAVFAFAAYHQLESGQAVTKVIRKDGKGHKADKEVVSELRNRQLVSVEGNDIRFSEDGLQVLSRAINGLKSAARTGQDA